MKTDADLQPLPIIKRGIYMHFRTKKEYRVLGVGRSTQTLEPLVFYEAMYDDPASPNLGRLWARPAAMWDDVVEFEGKKVKRFTFVKTESQACLR